VRALITQSGVDCRLIELEITESMLMHNPAEAAGMLNRLRRIGVKVSIDDFGTGYSSLAYLKRFPLDALKIDRTFVRDLTVDSDDAEIALAIISLAHNLKLKVVAEGVETEAQMNFRFPNQEATSEAELRGIECPFQCVASTSLRTRLTS
jgi:EAL domain-containing protein (putative c-di-GMP-specific phosphodiesterase class I)